MSLKKGVPFLADCVTNLVFPKNSRSTESDKLIGETSRFTCRNGQELDHQESWEDQIRALPNAAETCGGTWKRGSQAPVRSRYWPELPSQVKEAYPRP